MAGWFQSFNRNAERVITTLPVPELRPIYRGGAAPMHPARSEPLQRALIAQYVISNARLDILRRLLESTGQLRQALGAELHTGGR